MLELVGSIHILQHAQERILWDDVVPAIVGKEVVETFDGLFKVVEGDEMFLVRKEIGWEVSQQRACLCLHLTENLEVVIYGRTDGTKTR